MGLLAITAKLMKKTQSLQASTRENRWGVIRSLSPVLFFLISVPVAFVSTTLAVILWFGAILFQVVSQRWKPADSDRYLAH